MHSGEDEINAFFVHREQESFGANMLIYAAWHGRHEFVNELTGLPLPPELCRAARKKEIDYFKSKHLRDIRAVNEARRVMGAGPGFSQVG